MPKPPLHYEITDDDNSEFAKELRWQDEYEDKHGKPLYDDGVCLDGPEVRFRPDERLNHLGDMIDTLKRYAPDYVGSNSTGDEGDEWDNQRHEFAKAILDQKGQYLPPPKVDALSLLSDADMLYESITPLMQYNPAGNEYLDMLLDAAGEVVKLAERKIKVWGEPPPVQPPERISAPVHISVSETHHHHQDIAPAAEHHWAAYPVEPLYAEGEGDFIYSLKDLMDFVEGYLGIKFKNRKFFTDQQKNKKNRYGVTDLIEGTKIGERKYKIPQDKAKKWADLYRSKLEKKAVSKK